MAYDAGDGPNNTNSTTKNNVADMLNGGYAF